jgi:uncharacterized membrane protein YcaP (DUF421 family)
MESILRGAATYLLVWFIFRLTGKRTLAQITTFDAVLLLIISETTQSALTDQNNSFTNSVLLILTMLGLDVMFSCLKQRYSVIEKVMDGLPLVVFDESGLKYEAMRRERVDEQDILHASRDRQGISSLDDIRCAVLEPTGEITIIPKSAKP